jgi:hypothetical protein
MSWLKIWVLPGLFLLSPGVYAQQLQLDSIRANYSKAVNDKKLCQKMIANLGANSTSAVNLAYLGAYQTIWAKHVINPLSKLQTFNKGKKNIEKAVSAQPDEIEIRFIRLSVQKNCPAFLGYNTHIDEDSKILSANSKNVKSPTLKKMIDALLVN